MFKQFKQIEKTHKGLGLPLLFGNICSHASVSNFYIALVGEGKGTAIGSIKKFSESSYVLNSLTLNLLYERMNEVAEGEKVSWLIPEWSTLTDYHRTMIFTIGSQLITDKSYYHFLSSEKIIDIKNINLDMQVGVQPLKLKGLMKENENWESMASDRFLKFVFLNPLRKDNKNFNPVYEDFKIKDDVRLSKRIDLTQLNDLLKLQVSENRASLFSEKLIKSFCALRNKNRVKQKDVKKFYNLFWVYLSMYEKFTKRFSMQKRIELDAGSLHLFLALSKKNYLRVSELSKYFKTNEKSVNKCLQFLYGLELVKELQPSSLLSDFFSEYNTIARSNLR